jgi:DNA-binding helix-hairpin-helix protein with protein kinase domain
VTAFTTSSGRRLQLGQVIGKGGEATIFHVEGDDSIAIKLYSDGKELRRLEKVNAMISDRLYERFPFVAFPIDTISANGAFAGFTMRKVIGAKPMHQLCTPGDRKSEFPDANFRSLVRVALNFTRAVASINNLGVVIGDINESVALVDQKGLVTVIDSDSFQYRSRGQLFRCRVGKAEYTPPELQGQFLENVVRTVNHDAFGLAIIIFEILFMGRHPFSGIYKGKGNQPTISEAIQEGRFAYSQRTLSTQMEPPPHVPVLTDVPTEVAAAFQRAFGSPALKAQARPTAVEWVPILERMEKSIIECKANPAHYFAGNAPSCPWCRLEAGYGTVLFIAQPSPGRSTFNLDYVLSKIAQIQSPGPAPDLISVMPSVGKLKPSEIARDFKRRLWAWKAAGLAAAALASFLLFNGLGWGFLLLIPAGILFFARGTGAAAIRLQRSQAETIWKNSVENWNLDTGPRKFDEKKASLLRTATFYRTLPAMEVDMMQGLAKVKRNLQMQKQLEAHKLSKADIDGIGDGRKMTLRSFGIENAWDVNTRSVRTVPGFGPALTAKLTNWRRSIEARFVFNPNIPTDPAEAAKIRAEIAIRRNAMEKELLQGIKDLEIIKTEALAKRRDVKRYQEAYLAFRQAEVDVGSLGSLTGAL